MLKQADIEFYLHRRIKSPKVQNLTLTLDLDCDKNNKTNNYAEKVDIQRMDMKILFGLNNNEQWNEIVS